MIPRMKVLSLMMILVGILTLTGCQAKKLGIDTPVKIMPMGDHITEGVCDTSDSCSLPLFLNPETDGVAACSFSLNAENPKEMGYRGYLRDKLIEKGYQLTYVGSVSVVEGFSHEGHTRWTTKDFHVCIQEADMLKNAKPDIILLNVGIMETFTLQSQEDFKANMAQLVTDIYTKVPKTTYLLIAQIIPVGSNNRQEWGENRPINDVVADFNAQIQEVVDQFRAKGKNVVYVEMPDVIQSDEDFSYDLTVPGTVAAERMASIWTNAVVKILEQKP